ncbi:hypothetical protein [Halococcus hamelinensis]|uniref:Uncharacterized protein n=1 Tax=Halococcus hamelinensis 100A6 TaxID=1132509 RepID=M0M0V9_9EURY|nr:hypothetical protein [Halococcus hamelinensis]EMA39033.1 hypothetical protein C447_07748 [Halococcus hamelinensis 100A6]
MTIPPERRTNAIQTRSSTLGKAFASERVRALVEGVVLAAIGLGVYLAVVYPVSVTATPIGAGSPLNLLVLVATVLVLSGVYDLLRRVVR